MNINYTFRYTFIKQENQGKTLQNSMIGLRGKKKKAKVNILTLHRNSLVKMPIPPYSILTTKTNYTKLQV